MAADRDDITSTARQAAANVTTNGASSTSSVTSSGWFLARMRGTLCSACDLAAHGMPGPSGRTSAQATSRATPTTTARTIGCRRLLTGRRNRPAVTPATAATASSSRCAVVAKSAS
jgi:hypothetical protein